MGRVFPGLNLACFLLLVTLCLVVYAPSLRNGFVLDDDIVIWNSKNATQPGGLYRTWFTSDQLDYWPLSYTCFWAEWHLFGMDTVGYHVVSLVMHILNALLLWRILKHLRVPGAWLASIVFTVHPVCVEAVAWGAQQKALLSMLFFLLTLWAWLRSESRGSPRWYLGSLGLFVLALLSKSSVVVLPFVILACAGWIRGEVRLRDWLRSAPYFLLSLGSGLLTIWFQNHRVIGEGPVRSDGFFARLASAGQSVWFYISKALFPVDLAVVYPRWRIDPSKAAEWLPLVMLLVCFVVFFRFRRGWGRPFLFALAYVVACLLPILGFLDIHFMKLSLVADHWQYYAIPGVIALVAGVGTWLVEREGLRLRFAALAVAAVLVGLLAMAAREHTRVFRDEESFFRAAIATSPRSILLRFGLGDELDKRGKHDEARRAFEEGFRVMQARLQEGDVEPHEHILFGSTFLSRGMVEEARAQYREAIRLRAGSANAYYLLAQTFEHEGNPAEAIRHYQLAVGASPGYLAPNLALGQIMLREGRQVEAIRYFEAVTRINPGDAKAHGVLGDLLAAQGQPEQAAQHYRTVLELDPSLRQAEQKLRDLGY